MDMQQMMWTCEKNRPREVDLVGTRRPQVGTWYQALGNVEVTEPLVTVQQAQTARVGPGLLSPRGDAQLVLARALDAHRRADDVVREHQAAAVIERLARPGVAAVGRAHAPEFAVVDDDDLARDRLGGVEVALHQ